MFSRASHHSVRVALLEAVVVKAVEATAGDCLAKLPQPLDRTSAGYYVCFFDFGAMRMSKDELLAPFRQAFDSEDPGDGGCPGLPLYDI